MIIRKNPPSFVLIEKATGLVVYTRRATGVGSEAISGCVDQGRKLAAKTGKTYTVFLDVRGLKRGMKVSVPMVYALGITEEIRPSAATNPGRVRRNIFAFNNPPSGPADRDAARELELYIDNDSQLYHSQFIPIVKNLMLKRRKGIYRNDLAKKLFMYLMDAGARKYVAEFGTQGQKIDSMFNRNTRLLAANHFVFAFENEAHLGNYDHLIGPVSNPVRKNIFAFNNPRKLNTLEQAAAAVGLYITTWAPGDGKTRYRFHRKPADYHDGTGIYTAVGRADALNFIKAYGIEKGGSGVCYRCNGSGRRSTARSASGRELERHEKYGTPCDVCGGSGRVSTNPPSKSVRSFRVPRGLEAQVASMLRNAFIWAQATDGAVLTVAKPEIVKRAIQYVQKHGSAKNPLTSAERRSINRFEAEARSHNKFATTVGDRGGAIFTSGQANAINRIKHMIPCKVNPCENPRHGHIRRNPLLQTVLLANPGSVKTFNEMQDVGKAKYVVNYHDGVKVHRDGSPFFDIAIFSSRAKKDQFVRKLEGLGFTRGALRNPPISKQWDSMTRRQREALLEIVGYDRDYSYSMVNSSWRQLSPVAKKKLEAQWLDTTSSGGTTKRRRVPMAVNPLTRREAGQQLRAARRALTSGTFAAWKGAERTAAYHGGRASGIAEVVRDAGPKNQKSGVSKIKDRAQALRNPGIKFPKPGTRMTVAQAMDLARRIGDRELIRQCQEAMKLQKKANRGTKSVIWKTLPIGSPTKIDMVTAFTHYGDSPEDMYKAPKGSSKGQHMYRHKWGDGTGKSKPVPVLAAPGGKAIIKLMGPGQKVGDWMRG